jgi:glycosyltransferase involved in cell wall biosynthesis
MAAAEFAERCQAAEVIPAENADLLQKKIRELLEDEAHRDQLGKRAETVIRDWSYEQMVRDFISVFTEIRQGG